MSNQYPYRLLFLLVVMVVLLVGGMVGSYTASLGLPCPAGMECVTLLDGGTLVTEGW